jgi:acetoin utilization deacetylase AcuC-like enzyme/GNAT superfamily N-acetyltransferase
MFRIRRIYDDTLMVNQHAIAEVQQILREQFELISESEINSLPDKLNNPFKYRFRSILFVMDDTHGNVKGFALLMHAPDLNFCYLDYISASKKEVGQGVGGALYERVRQEALALGCIGIFMECLPDDPALSRDAQIRKQNIARLRFYERYGARPIINTAYETPLKPGDDNPPYLVFDDLGQNKPLSRKNAREIVRAILERKYGDLCPKAYIEMVVNSFQDDPVQLRPPKYIKEPAREVSQNIPDDMRILLLVNDKHGIHHIRERGYVESPVRIDSILKEIRKTDYFQQTEAKVFPEKHIREIHDSNYLDYFKTVCKKLPEGKSIYPYVFPIRNAARPPKELAVRAGYYCIDTFTPLNANAYLAAKGAVDCALTASERIVAGRKLAYALVRPPGHHAESKVFGGFCYFCTAAIAANYLSRVGKVAILDVDYHHGNGQQDIFYHRADVLTVSIHGHPSFAYPYFSGFEEEIGEGEGEGFNINYPLPEKVDGSRYRKTLAKALKAIREFDPKFLVVSLGLDPAKGDPTGTWSLTAKDFEQNGVMIGQLRLPTLVVQEGGYNTRNLGINARRFFTGLWKGCFERG